MSFLLSPVKLKSESSLKRGDPRVKHTHRQHQALAQGFNWKLFVRSYWMPLSAPWSHTHTNEKGRQKCQSRFNLCRKMIRREQAWNCRNGRNRVSISAGSLEERTFSWDQLEERKLTDGVGWAEKLFTVMKSGQLMKTGLELGQLVDILATRWNVETGFWNCWNLMEK